MTPPKRRPKGSGGLFQRKSDGLWLGVVDVGLNKDGKRRKRTVSSKSKAVAQRKLVALQREVAAGRRNPSGRLTVKAWADQWLPLHAENVRPTTYTTDAGAVRKWIVPTLGHIRLADLTPADMRSLRAAIVGAGRSSTTALHAHKIMAKMLRDAIEEEHHVPASVMKARKPRKAANDRAAIPVDQALAILRVVKDRPDAPRWMLSLLTGIRQGEALGLLWDHVDLDTGQILVEWQLQHLTAKHTAPDGWKARWLIGNAWLTETKTAKGERIIRMSALLHAAMVKARETWQENPWGLVWVDSRGLPIRDYADRAAWKEIQEAAGVAHPSGRPWHVHECRHTFITMLKRAGVDDAVIAQIVGQARLVASYVHLGGDDTLAAMEGLAGQLTTEETT